MRFPVVNLGRRSTLGHSAPMFTPVRTASFGFSAQSFGMGKLQPPPQWGGGTAPPPSQFMSHDQWERTKDARQAYCQAAERYADASDEELEQDLDTIYDALISVWEGLRPEDRGLAKKYALEACPELGRLMSRMAELQHLRNVEEFAEEVEARDPVPSFDPYKPGTPLPPEGEPIASPPVYGPQTPEPEYPEPISDVAFRPMEWTPGSPPSERLPTDIGVEQLAPVPTVSQFNAPAPPPPPPPPLSTPPVGEPVATGGGQGGCPWGQFPDGRGGCRGAIDWGMLQAVGGIAAGAGGGTIAPSATALAPSMPAAITSLGALNPFGVAMLGQVPLR